MTDVDLRSARDARGEARSLVGEGYEPLVLEPSPPADTTEPFVADDPMDPARSGGRVIVPAGVPGGARTWDQWLTEHPERAGWVAERWLGGERRLPALPASFGTSLLSLHRLGAYVIAPVRHAATGKFGLRFTLGGFGTPFFGDDRQVRVVHSTLVDQTGGTVRTSEVTTLAAAAAFLGGGVDEQLTREHDRPAAGDVDAPLHIDPAATDFLGAWYGMAFAALEILRADPASAEPSRPQVWPGHFDAAIEIGAPPLRASYGASPGDGTIDEPYLYVSVWDPAGAGVERGEGFWGAATFPGRVLRLSALPSGADPVPVAAAFWAETRDRLRSRPG